MRDTLKTLSPQQRADAGALVTAHVERWLDERPDINHVALFCSLPDEISTHELDAFLIKRHKNRFLPWVISSKAMSFIELPPHQSMAMSTPAAPSLLPNWAHATSISDLDVIFVPGLAFDKCGHRLGRGQGYYDRALGGIPTPKRPLLIGLAMDEQIVPNVPAEEHDVVMDYLCTPGWGMMKRNEM